MPRGARRAHSVRVTAARVDGPAVNIFAAPALFGEEVKMEIRLTLAPGQNGAKKLAAEYGDRLIYLRALSLRRSNSRAAQDRRADRRNRAVETAQERTPAPAA